ncbi:MAG: hypothetical protein RLZZ24_971 [Pseudomonadota bacterium]
MTEIEQTPGDRLRFEIILKSLAEGGNNLAILSEHDLVLDFYANLLDERLRALGNCEVEFCFSTNSERLVQKFNEILGELTVDQALTKEEKHAKRRYLVFRDSILMQDFELQLLARLVNGFPASNICVILLINSAGSNRNKLDAFGKTLLQWEVETRAGEPRKALGDWVAPAEAEALPNATQPVLESESPADAGDVAKLLTPPQKPSWRIPVFGRKDKPAVDTPSTTDTSAASAASMVADTTALPAFAPSEPARVADTPRQAAPRVTDLSPAQTGEPDLWTTPSEPDFKPATRRFPWGLLLLVPVITAGVFAFMYSDLIEQEVESFRKYLLRGTPAPVSAPAPNTDAAQASSEKDKSPDAETPADANATSSADPSASKATDNAPPSEVPPSQSLPSSKVAAVDVASTPAPPPAAPATSVRETAATTKEVANEPKVSPKSDEAWMEQLAPSSFVIQLAAFDSEEEMQVFKRSEAIYAKARVLKVRKKDSNKRYYVLIAGPYASKEDAQAVMQSNALLSKGWLRSAKSLKAQL